MFTLNCKGRLLVLDRPLVMGIINTTPDSFYAGSRPATVDEALLKAEQMLEEGAAMLDLGGQSTRPGSIPIDARTEGERVLPFIEAIHRRFPETLISVDTFFAQVAREAVAAGASLVNDTSAGLLDPAMLSSVAGLKVPYVCMHMKGTPQNMQQDPQYDHVTTEVIGFFMERLRAIRQAGITDVIVDPGFGFGKTMQHNFQLMRELSALSILQKPVLCGISRKATIYRTLGVTAEQALNGTTVLQTLCLLQGASILRVHDVREAVESIRLLEAAGALPVR